MKTTSAMKTVHPGGFGVWCLVLGVVLPGLLAGGAFGATADLSVVVSNGASTVYAGRQTVYVITVNNAGPDDVPGVVTSAVISPELTGITWTAIGADSAGGPQSGVGSLHDTRNLPMDGAVTYLVSGIVDSGILSGNVSVSVTVEGPAELDDPAQGNNSGSDVDAIMTQTVTNVRSEFVNETPAPNAGVGGAAADNGVIGFNGHVGDRTGAPLVGGSVSGRYVLKASSFGQPVGQFVVSPSYINDTIEAARDQLFYRNNNDGTPAGISENIARNQRAAFRYINMIFGNVAGTGTERIAARLADEIPYDTTVNLADGDVSEEEIALGVAGNIRDTLALAPYDTDLRNLLLDTYYYRTLARTIKAKDKVADAYQINFSRELSAEEAFGTPINLEIQAFEEAATALNGVLDPYRELLADRMGVNYGDYDRSYTGGDQPFGYYLFVTEVPRRSVYSATYIDDINATPTDPFSVALGASTSSSLIHVSPGGFSVAAGGTGETGPSLRITVRNIGPGPLDYTAVPVDPVDSGGQAVSMLSFQGDSFVSSGTLVSGRTATIEVAVAENTSTLSRTGRIEIRDTNTGGLTYNVAIVQAGTQKGVFQADTADVVFHYGTLPPEGYFSTKRLLFNSGAGTLSWSATVIGNNLFEGTGGVRVPWLEIKGGDDASFGSEAHGTGTSWIEFRAVSTYYSQLLAEGARQPLVVRLTAASADGGPAPINSPVDIQVYYDDMPPAAELSTKSLVESMLAKSGRLLLITPPEIEVASAAVQQNVYVRDGDLFTWSVTTAEGASWLSAQADVDVPGLVRLTIEANTGPARRTGTVQIQSAETSPSVREVRVVQEGTSHTGIAVNPASRSLPSTAGESVGALSVNLSNEDPEDNVGGFEVRRAGIGNVAWRATVTQGRDWLRIVAGESGTNDGEILFGYDANAQPESRRATIEVTSSDAASGQHTVAVVVDQLGTSSVPVLTGGYKDIALLFDVLCNEAQVRKELAKRYALRRIGNDVQRANDLVEETLTRHTAAINDLGGLIPNWRQQSAMNPQLYASYMSWQQALSEMESMKDFLAGNTNVLGFQEDFLFLVQRFPGQPEDLFDSYDKLADYITHGNNAIGAGSSPLGFALAKYETARQRWETFAETQSQLREEFRTQNLDHRKWMFDNLGIDPGNDPDNPQNAQAYFNPAENFGSNMWQQARAIERAGEVILQNQAELDNVSSQINTELWRRGQESQTNQSIANVYIQYGDKLASIEEKIGAIQAAQAMANQLSEITNAEKHIFSAGFSVVSRLINGALQSGAEVAKGVYQGDKAQLAAAQSSDIKLKEDQILGVNSQALIRNLTEQANLVRVRGRELGIALTQEYGTRQAMLDEWRYRESLMRENSAALLNQYCADPVHRLRMRHSMLEAEASFQVAQRWMFFLIKALEYKWNVSFYYSNETGTWSTDSLFRARTAKDLESLLAAVKDFDGMMQGASRGDDRFDWFSFKKDFMGLTTVYEDDGVTESAVYANPATGYAATATEVFQTRLYQAWNKDTGVIELPFSTFCENDATFFRGPRRDPKYLPRVLSRGQYLDKIVWLKVNVLGDFPGTGSERVAGSLTYSGGSYVRSPHVGTMDATRPDSIADEFNLWPTKLWFFDPGLPYANPPVQPMWRSSDEQTTEIALTLTAVPRHEAPESVSQIDVFSERSVACDGWVLRIFAGHEGQEQVKIKNMKDVEILFYHVSKDRPNFQPGGAKAGIDAGE